MLAKLFPRRHSHYASLPILGSIMDCFVRFHVHNGYSPIPTRLHVRTAAKVDAVLRQTGCRSLKEVTREKLHACGPPPGRSQDNINIATTPRLLERYLDGGCGPERLASLTANDIEQFVKLEGEGSTVPHYSIGYAFTFVSTVLDHDG